MFFGLPANTGYYLDTDGEFCDWSSDNEFSGIGSFFKKLAKTVAPVAAGFIPVVGGFASAGLSSILGGGGSGGGPAKGTAAITAYGNEVINGLNELKAQVSSDPAGTVSQAQTIVGYLSDSSRVYQPKKGKDKQALDNAKAQAARILSEIQALAAQAETQAQQLAAQQAQAAAMIPAAASADGSPVVQLPNGQSAQLQTLPNGQQIYVPVAIQNDGAGGVDTQTLLMAGFGAVIVILLLRR